MVRRRIFGPRISPVRRYGGIVAAATFFVASAWLGGFLSFVHSLPEPPREPVAAADAIVALTGGRDRIVVAMQLLSAHKGQRLLISGVHGQTSRADLKRLVDDPDGRFDCCVDLDRAAHNTVGNAIETARWARARGYRSLIVVTAQYHMPRSLVELSRALPECTLTPYAVVPAGADAWWRPGTARLLAAEYTKFLVSQLRITIADLGGGPAQV